MAATYDVTPVNGGDNATGTLYSTAQLKAFLITIGNGSGGQVDLQGVDGAYGSVYDLILRELSPMLAFAPSDTSGEIRVVMDGHANTAASVLARVEAIDGVGNDSSVTEATSIDLA